jgi:hypothetical protein
VVGPYQPEARTGPTIWIRCLVDRTLQEPALPADRPPIVYLPEVARQALRAGDDGSDGLKPSWNRCPGGYVAPPGRYRLGRDPRGDSQTRAGFGRHAGWASPPTATLHGWERIRENRPNYADSRMSQLRKSSSAASHHVKFNGINNLRGLSVALLFKPFGLRALQSGCRG